MSLKCKSCEHRFFQVGREVHSTCAITKEHVWSYVQLDTLSKKCPFSESNKKEIEKEQRENAEVKQAQQQEEDLKEAEQVATENNQQQQQQPTQEEEKEISVATPQAQNTQNLNQILNTIKKSIPHQPQQFVRKK
jgi:flagellar motor protein MotB